MRRILKYTWTAFFSRFTALTPVQKKTIPHILDKKDVLIISPTASGKTEAVIVPIIELLLREKWQGLSVIYISPTKALCNDLYLRFREICKEINVEVTIKTGDKPKFKSSSSGILITTPESFDSLLCRHQDKLSDLRALIIDEIHLLDNSFRGDQLRMLVKRAKLMSNFPVQVNLLSATVPKPVDLALRYCSVPEIIMVDGNRNIKHTIIEEIEEIEPFMQKENLRKILIFCNTRSNVEIMANICKKIWGEHNVVAHHGSLSTSVRHEAESFMKENFFGVCVSTMTLEIGIDIGNLDAVVLADVPLSLSSLLQRIGRSNRRSGVIRVFAISRNFAEKIVFEAMISAAIEGKLEDSFYEIDYGVIVQQIFSLLYAFPSGIKHDSILKFFREFCANDVTNEILNNLKSLNWINNRKNFWFAETKLMNMGFCGKIHSNIPDNSECKVIDIANKKVIGKVTGQIDNVFVLAGKIWKIVLKKNYKIYVKSVNKSDFDSRFVPSSSLSRFFNLLPLNLKVDSK